MYDPKAAAQRISLSVDDGVMCVPMDLRRLEDVEILRNAIEAALREAYTAGTDRLTVENAEMREVLRLCPPTQGPLNPRAQGLVTPIAEDDSANRFFEACDLREKILSQPSNVRGQQLLAVVQAAPALLRFAEHVLSGGTWTAPVDAVQVMRRALGEK